MVIELSGIRSEIIRAIIKKSEEHDYRQSCRVAELSLPINHKYYTKEILPWEKQNERKCCLQEQLCLFKKGKKSENPPLFYNFGF